MKKLFILLIRFYQKFLSPLKIRSTCKYYPTCSQYAIDAITEWGIVRGLGLAIWRLLRCNPFSKGGIDYVPRNEKKHR